MHHNRAAVGLRVAHIAALRAFWTDWYQSRVLARTGHPPSRRAPRTAPSGQIAQQSRGCIVHGRDVEPSDPRCARQRRASCRASTPVGRWWRGVAWVDTGLPGSTTPPPLTPQRTALLSGSCYNIMPADCSQRGCIGIAMGGSKARRQPGPWRARCASHAVNTCNIMIM